MKRQPGRGQVGTELERLRRENEQLAKENEWLTTTGRPGLAAIRMENWRLREAITKWWDMRQRTERARDKAIDHPESWPNIARGIELEEELAQEVAALLDPGELARRVS